MSLMPWYGPWRIIKVLSDVSFCIEEERRKPGKYSQRGVVHFNYLELCHYPPPVTLSASWRELGGHVQRKAFDSIKVEMVAGHVGHIQIVLLNSSEIQNAAQDCVRWRELVAALCVPWRNEEDDE